MLAASPNTFGRESLDVSARFDGVSADDGSGAPVISRWSVFVWVVSWTVQIFACISLLYFAEVKVTCVVTFFGESTETTVYRRLTLQIVDTLSSGTCLTVFFAYPHRYVARSRQHFWTLCFVCASFVGSWTALMFMMATCGYGRFHDIQFVTMAFSNLVSMVILLWLCLLKVRSVAAAAPCMVRVCEISAIVIAIAGTLCAIVLIMKLTDGRLVVLFGCASLLLILGFGTFFFAVVYVLSRAGRAALSEALQTDVDEKSSCQIRIAAKWTIITAITSAAAGASSIIYFVTHLFTYIRKSPDAQIILGDVRCVDAIMNRAAALFLSGMLDKSCEVKRTSIHLQQVRATLHSQRRRDIEERLLNEAGASTGSALTIIALMDGVDPNIVLQEAVSRFRCVSWETLATRPDIIVGGGPLDVLGPGGNDLHSLSQPCELSFVARRPLGKVGSFRVVVRRFYTNGRALPFSLGRQSLPRPGEHHPRLEKPPSFSGWLQQTIGCARLNVYDPLMVFYGIVGV
eukprot:TRINITY_DN934_c0_g1_i1.p1 TRINITY_DN934_c0_g1~~TRINITY_DN934_c0_g1_i1.p1  ORF type:complete len:515 (+),score=25.19 TRINITY_DN934_c0_g1_i1:107-1651(+)